jgi:hypothetical protein
LVASLLQPVGAGEGGGLLHGGEVVGRRFIDCRRPGLRCGQLGLGGNRANSHRVCGLAHGHLRQGLAHHLLGCCQTLVEGRCARCLGRLALRRRIKYLGQHLLGLLLPTIERLLGRVG